MAFDGTLKFDTAIDQSGFLSGLTGLGSLAKSGFSVIGGAAAAVTGAITAASRAAVGLGMNAIKVGKEFEAGMSQVQATLGITVNDLQNNIGGAADTMEALTAKAEEMGATTQYTAAQAAEGLNILAMSGYDAESSISMLDSTLNMAAAGGLQLGNAAQYITGSMKGFTEEAGKFADTTEASTYYADMIAKGATLAATNVGQLGEAMSGAAAIANSYKQSSLETEVALLRLAEQGEVGSAAATMLSATMKNLYTPTNQAKQALEQLGVKAYDEAGNMREFNTVVDELYAALSEYDPETASSLEDVIFGIQGKEGFDKMVVSSREKVQEFYAGLAYTEDGAMGSAAAQAEAMMDNLQGDITYLESAVDGLYNTLYKSMNGTLRELVKLGNGYVTELTDAFNSGGFEGAAEKLGSVLSDALDHIGDYLPDVVGIGSNIVSSLISGISGNSTNIIETGLDMGLKMLSGFGDITVNFLDLGANLMSGLATGIESKHLRITRISREIIRNLMQAIGSDLPMMIESGAEIISILADSILFNLPYLTEYGNEAVQKIAEAIKKSLPDILEVGAGLIGAFGGAILDSLPVLLECAVQIVDALVGTISNPDDLSALIGAATLIVTTLGGALLDNLPILLNAGMQIVSMLMDTLSDPEALTELLDAGVQIITKLSEILTENLSPLLGAVIQIIGTLGEWIGEHALDLVSAGLVIVKALTDAVIKNLPLLLDAAVQIVEGLAKGIEEDSADVLIAVEEIIRTLLNFLLSPDTLQKIGETGGKIIRALIPAAVELAGDLLGFAYDLFDETIAAVAKMQWGEIGKEIVEGIISGMIGTEFDLDSYLKEFKKNWVSGFKDIFGIHSPSTVMRDEIGKNLALGLGEGFSDNITNAAEQAFDTITDIHVDPAALEMMLNASPMQMNFIQPSPTASITNNYTTNATTNSANYSTENAPSGDIIIPVQIGGEQVETLVITAAQIANARSGGEVL